jgi:hypothetical protein
LLLSAIRASLHCVNGGADVCLSAEALTQMHLTRAPSYPSLHLGIANISPRESLTTNQHCRRRPCRSLELTPTLSTVRSDISRHFYIHTPWRLPSTQTRRSKASASSNSRASHPVSFAPNFAHDFMTYNHAQDPSQASSSPTTAPPSSGSIDPTRRLATP